MMAVVVSPSSSSSSPVIGSSRLPSLSSLLSLLSLLLLPATPMIIVKTKESFKLADLYCMNVQLLCDSISSNGQQRRHYKCEPLLGGGCDVATGSCLLKVEQIDSDDASDGNSRCDHDLASALHQRRGSSVDWIARAIVSNCTTVSELLARIEEKSTTTPDGGEDSSASPQLTTRPWTISYRRVTMTASPTTVNSGSGSGRSNQTRKRKVERSSLMCAVAQSIKTPIALNSDDAEDRLIMVEADVFGTHSNGDGDDDDSVRFYLLKQMKEDRPVPSTTTTMNMSRWSNRPFPYSSAINPTVAEVVVDILQRCLEAKATSLAERKSRCCLLDPTCGCGTFLATALSRGGFFRTVVGWDSNPKCIEGCRSNLEYMFDDPDRSAALDRVVLEVRDSSFPVDNDDATSVSRMSLGCVACNLPWGLNSINYHKESYRILQGVRSSLLPGVPCAFVSKEPLSEETLEQLGYRCLRNACIPQRNFRLPHTSKRKNKRPAEANDDETTKTTNGIPRSDRRTSCVITIAETM